MLPPDHLDAKLTADGVTLSWGATTPNIPDNSGARFIYRLYRRDSKTSQDAVAGEVPLSSGEATLTDHGFEWEKTYEYRATVVTVIAQANGEQREVEGDDSPAIRVVTNDVFPPTTPSGLQAVFSGPGQQPFIDLVWAPNNEPDLAGYNVYRSEGGVQAQRVNRELLKSPAYRDNEVSTGHQYTYSVSAIDVRGNESGRSEEASESVP